VHDYCSQQNVVLCKPGLWLGSILHGKFSRLSNSILVTLRTATQRGFYILNESRVAGSLEIRDNGSRRVMLARVFAYRYAVSGRRRFIRYSSSIRTI